MRWIAVASAIAVLAGLGAGSVHYRNAVVALDVATEAQWQQVESQRLRQHELIPALVEITRGYTAHERDVQLGVAQARADAYSPAHANANAPNATMDPGQALGRLLAVAEDYPDLKADRRFRDLQLEVAGTQNRIAVERHRYNDLVAQYNARLRMLPWMLVAFDLEERKFFEPAAEQLEAPSIDF